MLDNLDEAPVIFEQEYFPEEATNAYHNLPYTVEYNEEEVIPMLEVSFMGMIGAFKMEATENEETV